MARSSARTEAGSSSGQRSSACASMQTVSSTSRSARSTAAWPRNIDLLFIDLVLPGEIGGAELADGARRLRPGLRILFTSGFTQMRSPPPEDGWTRAKLVTKPYTTVELATRLRQALNGSERFNARP